MPLLSEYRMMTIKYPALWQRKTMRISWFVCMSCLWTCAKSISCNKTARNAKGVRTAKKPLEQTGEILSIHSKSTVRLCDCLGGFPQVMLVEGGVLVFGGTRIQLYDFPNFAFRSEYVPPKNIKPHLACDLHQSRKLILCHSASGVHVLHISKDLIAHDILIESKGEFQLLMRAISSDGKYYVAVTQNGEGHVFDIQRRRKSGKFMVATHPRMDSSNANSTYYMSGVDDLLAVECSDGMLDSLQVWSIPNGIRSTIATPDQAVRKALCTGNLRGKRNLLVSLGGDGRISLMEFDARKNRIGMRERLLVGGGEEGVLYAISSDASRLVTYAARGRRIGLWDLSSGRLMSEAKLRSSIGKIDIGGSGEYIVLYENASSELCPRVGFVTAGRLSESVEVVPFQERIVAFDYNSSSTALITLSPSGMLEEVDIATGKVRRGRRIVADCPSASVSRLRRSGYAVVCNPEDDSEAFERRDSPSILLVDDQLRERKRFKFDGGFFYMISAPSGGQAIFASGALMAASHIFVDGKRGVLRRDRIPSIGANVSVDSRGRRVLGHDGRSLRMLDTSTGGLIVSMPENGISVATIDHSGRSVAILDKKGELSVIDAAGKSQPGRHIGVIRDSDVFHTLMFDKTGELLAVVGMKTIMIFNVLSKEVVVKRSCASQCGIREARFSGDSAEIGVLTKNGEVTRIRL